MQIHDTLVKTHQKKKRIGRGGKRGTTSGRGTKGQKARAGRRIRPAIRDLIKKIPKKRGVKFSSLKPKATVITLDTLEKNFKSGEKVTPRVLEKRGLISVRDYKRGSSVKVLDVGKLSKKLILENIKVSNTAAKKIISLGGEVRHIEK